MKKSTVIWLIVAASLMIVGVTVSSLAMSALDWDFKKLGSSQFDTKTYEINDDFSDISIDTDIDDIVFLLSEDGECKVVCDEYESISHTVEVENETLVIKSRDDRKWYEHIGISIENPKLTVHLPKTDYSSLLINENTGLVELPKDFEFVNIDIETTTGCVKTSASAKEKIKIKTSTGLVKVSDVSVETLEITVTTGMVNIQSVSCTGDIEINVSTGMTEMKNVTCVNFESSGSTGGLSMTNVIAEDSFSIERSTGDIEFDGCDANEIYVTTDTGEVEGSLLTEKIFFAETDTGDISVPKSTKGGKCEITTDTGDINIRID